MKNKEKSKLTNKIYILEFSQYGDVKRADVRTDGGLKSAKSIIHHSFGVPEKDIKLHRETTSDGYFNEGVYDVTTQFKNGGSIPSSFTTDTDTDKWFNPLIEYVRSGRADDPRLPELMQIANGEPTEANLLRFKAELTECTCHEPKIKENIIKNINSILEESDEEEIDFFFTVFADAVNKGQDKTENYSETEFLKYAHDVIFDLLKNDRSVGMKESSDWNIYTNNGLYYIQPMVHLQKGNTDIVKSAAFTMFNDMDVAVAEFIFDENGEFTAISKRFGWNKKIFCGGGNVYAKGGGISSPKEYFESIDTSLLPQSASEYLASPYILYHPELQNLSMDDEDFKNVMEIIESNYSKVEEEQEEEQEEAMTVESYREMIEGLELMLTLTKGKEKQEIKDELEGIKLLAEIEFPTEKFCGGGSVPAMKSGGHARSNSYISKDDHHFSLDEYMQKLEAMDDYEFGAAAENELGYNPSEDEEWSETMREDVTHEMVRQYGKVQKSRGINV